MSPPSPYPATIENKKINFLVVFFFWILIRIFRENLFFFWKKKRSSQEVDALCFNLAEGGSRGGGRGGHLRDGDFFDINGRVRALFSKKKKLLQIEPKKRMSTSFDGAKFQMT